MVHPEFTGSPIDALLSTGIRPRSARWGSWRGLENARVGSNHSTTTVNRKMEAPPRATRPPGGAHPLTRNRTMRFIVRSLQQLRRSPRDWLMRHRDDGLQMGRVSIAAALSWLISERLLPDTTPVLAPLTAILCVQVTVYRSATTALQRASGVIVGVLLAFAVARGLGLHAWSVGLITAAALLIGAALRLRSESAEIAVSALLVLAVGSAPPFAAVRILETLIGLPSAWPPTSSSCPRCMCVPPTASLPSSPANAPTSWPRSATVCAESGRVTMLGVG